MASNSTRASTSDRRRGFLNWVEWLGNKLPDPAVLFVLALLATWVLSAVLARVEFTEIDPRTLATTPNGEPPTPRPIRIHNQLTGAAMAEFLASMVKNFTGFAPLGVVLVALLGVGVAEHTGFINAGIKSILAVTPVRLLTPMLLLVSLISHTAADTGYVLVIPLGGVIFYAAGRHPLAGIVTAFAGVSGGFAANFIPSGIDPLLQGITQQAAQILDVDRTVNPLCNWIFMSSSCALIILAGWYLTDRHIEPRLVRQATVDGDPAQMPTMTELSQREVRGLLAAMASIALGMAAISWWAAPADSPLRARAGGLTAAGAPLMEMIVPLIFLLSLLPGVVYGCVAGTVKSHRDVIQGMSRSMSTMGYYLVMAFFASQFIYAFGKSNLGPLVAVKGAAILKSLGLPGAVTIVGIVALTASVDLIIGSASAKWALLGPILVPMLMQVGMSPELTQAAYRVGDSSVNIVTPLMPYFPLVVVYCQKYVKGTGMGTLISLMLPYSLVFLVSWTGLLLAFWSLGIPLGLQAPYTWEP